VKIVSTDDVEIATYDLGGDGPALLLAHATGFHGRVWLPVVAHLRSRFHCYAYDARGHGMSGKAPEGHYDWSHLAADAAAVIDGLGLVRPFGVGHSGGGAAVILAEEASPGTFAGLYLYEPVIFPVDERQALELMALRDGNPLEEGARRRREVFPSRAAAAENYRGKPPFVTFDPSSLDAYVEWGFEDLDDGTVRLLCRGEDEARFYEMAMFHGAFGRLHRVARPVTLACGGVDAHFGPEAIGLVASQLPHARTEVLPDVGHLGPMEQPGLVAASIIRAFEGG
jgi:pimeloyl-ACP methyl ester carboxylesterase